LVEFCPFLAVAASLIRQRRHWERNMTPVANHFRADLAQLLFQAVSDEAKLKDTV